MGLTQQQLGEKMFLTKDMIARYEKAPYSPRGTVPSIQRWRDLARILRVSFNDLTQRFEDPDVDLSDARGGSLLPSGDPQDGDVRTPDL